ncbi:hypothetical protein B0J11DRAFT_448958 [Dendryphion nanum]|uniref:Rhodopsin domain-containing protein n=1 Tax=Dendryphion nanum TaxID=256645 RepID=A0A9P9CZ47_9PLEO|nr:hypothetical protein B0J11DRAFT_448958 [Dendryphion nanum]
MLYGITITLLKVSILLHWLRIFVPTGQRTVIFWASHILIWTNVVFYATGTLIEIFQCWPREKIWNPLYMGGHCSVDMTKHMIIAGIVNIISDIAILILPHRVIWTLKISSAKKLAMSVLFGIGIFACTTAVVRLIYFMKIVNSEDMVYTTADQSYWSIAEMTAGFLIMGLPSLPKVMKSFVGLPWVNCMIGPIARRVPCVGHPQSNSRRGLPSWYKPKLSVQRNGHFDVSNGDSQQDMVESGRNIIGDGVIGNPTRIDTNADVERLQQSTSGGPIR